jgi:AraC-like DNA-binding protein
MKDDTAFAASVTASTVPQDKNALVEHFTGVRSEQSAEGHRILNGLIVTHPGRIFCINIHSGVYADNTYTMRRDDLLFSPANRLPDILNQSRDFRCTVFALDGKKTEDILYACLRKETDWIDKLHFVLRHPMIHLSPRQVKLIDSYRQLVHLYADETGRYRRRVAFLQGQSIIYELLSWVDEVMRPSGDSRTIVSSRMNQLYVAFLKLLDENGGTQRQVSWYAVQLQISSAYLNQVCRICIGKSPQAMIQDILCKESKRLLLSTDLNVKQIAYHLRFATEAAFCKFFRKQAGVSPAQFRANK